MKQDKVLGMVGLAKRAGKVSSGEFICSKTIKDGSARLIIIALDAAPNTAKTIKDACAYYKVEYIEHGNKDDLGRFTGNDERAVVSINDKNFAQAIMKKYSAITKEN